MKTIKTVRVNFLRVYPVERDVTSSVNGVKGTRAGALVLIDSLPHSDGQKEQNAIELSGKQLNNLASMHGIRSTGRSAWNDLAGYVQVGKAVAVLSCEEHKAGDTYVDKDGVEQKYTQTSTNCNVDSIVLADKIADKIVNAIIEKNINWKDQNDLVEKMLGTVVEPELQGVK